MTTSNCINWLFGRGLSMACNLSWVVPQKWANIPRDEKIEIVKEAIWQEMHQTSIDTTVIRQLLSVLERHTAQNWRHYFITTNWDYLLQREIQALNMTVLPPWLTSSHVFHLNGTIERLLDNSNRSHILLEEDPASQRCNTVEANTVYNHIIWQRLFIVIGMSFECETDKFLLSALNRVEDDMPIGESTWVVVNRNQSALDAASARISAALPNATIIKKCITLEAWLDNKLPELGEYGAFSYNQVE